eukprot:CFRG1639T1
MAVSKSQKWQSNASTGCLSRLRNDLSTILDVPVPGCNASPKGDDLLQWAAVVEGPEGSPYANGIFFLELSFTKDYPFRHPEVLFRTRIFHCNVQDNGSLSPAWLGARWKSSTPLRELLISICGLLELGNPESIALHAVTPQMYDLFAKHRGEYNKIAQDWTTRFAS